MDGDCCEMMLAQVTMQCEYHPDLNDCPDAVVLYSPKLRMFGIPIRDGGPSQLSISFCPWCGTRLPESQADRWFDELEQIGVEVGVDKIPLEYQDDTWWKRRGDDK